MDDPVLDRFVVDLDDAAPAADLLRPDGVGRPSDAIAGFHEAFPARSGSSASILWLFDRTVADLEAFLGEQDLVYVGGGNTVSMLAVWRAHGVDRALRAAYDGGRRDGRDERGRELLVRGVARPTRSSSAAPTRWSTVSASSPDRSRRTTTASRRGVRRCSSWSASGALPAGSPATTTPPCTSSTASFGRRSRRGRARARSGSSPTDGRHARGAARRTRARLIAGPSSPGTGPRRTDREDRVAFVVDEPARRARGTAQPRRRRAGGARRAGRPRRRRARPHPGFARA